MTHLYLIRHADYTYAAEKEGENKRDLGLSPEGVGQAERLRDRLQRTGELKPDVFVSSSERGAAETAAILSPALGLSPTLDDGVQEWRSEDGSLSSDEFTTRWQQTPESQKLFYRWVEGCENWLEFSLRVHLALNRILQAHDGKNIVIVTHGGVIQASFVYFFGMGTASVQKAGIDLKRTSITHWYNSESQPRWTLERFNDYYHLL